MEIYIKELNTELNAFDIYGLFKEEKNTILLDSAKVESKLSEFSFVGVNPFLVFKSYKDKIWINGESFKGNAFFELSKLLDKYKVEAVNKEIPFISGAMGYFSYDIGETLENLKDTALNDVYIPQSYFVFYDNIIIENIKNKKIYVSSLGILKNKEESISDIEKIVLNGEKIIERDFLEKDTKFYSNFTKKEYKESVKKVKEYIKSGDIYITNLTQRFWCFNDEDSFKIYKKLRMINKAPFAAFLNLEGFEIISSSPERFLKIRDKIVDTRPIKGTRRRGENLIEDERLKLELLNSAKDRSELLMIVDLERNDLSKVCKPYSVKVTELFKLEEYSTVFHLISNIHGALKDGVTAVKCLEKCFPGGSITGAPKIRSQEIIEEIEGVKRGIYTGCIGYFDFSGNSDFNIIIRTILKKDGKAYFGVGGGITIDSDEEMEYIETIDKARALMRVL